MKLTAKIKLLPSKRQAEKLLATIQEANKAANVLSDFAWEKKVFKQVDLHKAQYYALKESFTLSSQMVVRCIAKVTDAYKLDKNRGDARAKRTFRPTGAIAYDTRILSYDLTKKRVSIWTVDGRMKIEYVGGKHNEGLLQYQKGESDLLYTKRGDAPGKFFLLATCDIPDNDTHIPEDVLGVDLGIVTLATDSDGQSFTGEKVEATRQWYAKRRGVLQSVGTKSAKRRLKKLSGKQKRFQSDTNHVISKQLVTKAKATHRSIAIEDLKGISKQVRRDEKRLRKSQRSKHSNWSFNQLRQFLEYKSTLYGVSLILVDPRNTSRTCSVCSHCEKANRKSQAEFVCRSCGHSANADYNASQNIKSLAVPRPGFVNLPMVSAPYGG